MGQIWELINVDRRECGLAGGSKLVEFFFEDMMGVYRSLQTPCLSDVVDEWLEQGPVAQQRGSIGKLSTEVLDMVFQEILNDKDEPGVNLVSCICFALGCKRLLIVGKRHILDGLARYYVRAAGCRLVCLGEATDATDQAPPGMLTDEEIKEIAETKVRAEDDPWAIRARAEDPDSDPNVILERCLYEFAMEFYESEAARQNKFMFAPRWVCMELWARLGPEWLLEERGDTVQLRDRAMVGTLSQCPTYAPGPNVLLNLVKGEYVREAALVELGRVYNRVSLAHAMLARVCYSIDPSVADEYCGEEFVGRFGRGPWAGDRFCIVSERDMPVPRDGCGFEEWRDVTEEVNRLLENIWKGMCRED